MVLKLIKNCTIIELTLEHIWQFCILSSIKSKLIKFSYNLQDGGESAKLTFGRRIQKTGIVLVLLTGMILHGLLPTG